MKKRIISILIILAIFIGSSALMFAQSKYDYCPNGYKFKKAGIFPNSNYPYYDEPNGCSVPTVVKFTYSTLAMYSGWFNNSCNKHDYCYMTYGSDKDSCDSQFHWDMIEDCMTIENNEQKEECKEIAGLFFKAVSIVGSRNFSKAQDKAAQYLTYAYYASEGNCGEDVYP